MTEQPWTPDEPLRASATDEEIGDRYSYLWHKDGREDEVCTPAVQVAHEYALAWVAAATGGAGEPVLWAVIDSNGRIRSGWPLKIDAINNAGELSLYPADQPHETFTIVPLYAASRRAPAEATVREEICKEVAIIMNERLEAAELTAEKLHFDAGYIAFLEMRDMRDAVLDYLASVDAAPLGETNG